MSTEGPGRKRPITLAPHTALRHELDLDSIEAKLDRAAEHFRTLEEEIDAWRDKDPYRLVRHTNPQATRYSLIVDEVVHAPNLLRWSLVAADCIHNLRAVLDHLVYAIGIAQGAAIKRSGLTLPLKDSPDDFKSAYWKIAALSPKVRAAIQSVQPYNRRHPTLPPLLAVLRNLNDTDKHQLLQLAVMRALEGGFYGVTLPRDQPFAIDYQMGDIERGTEIAAIVLDRPTPHMSYEQFTALVAVTIKSTDMPAIERADIGALIPLLRGEVLAVADILIAAAHSCAASA